MYMEKEKHWKQLAVHLAMQLQKWLLENVIKVSIHIWSVGIILYAMTCGYLPFEDPNTSKLYKKILNCDYLIPGFISKASKDLIKKVLNTDPLKRITIAEIRNHEWYNQVKPAEIEGIIIGKDRVPVIEEFLSKINDCFVTS